MRIRMEEKPSLDAIPSKLREADFFLRQMENEDRILAVQYYFSAFSSAARSVTFVLQRTLSHLEDFDDWYEPHQNKLKNNPLANLMKNQRNQLLKEGTGGITGGSHYADDRDPTFRFDFSVGPKYGISRRENNVVGLCQEYMELLTEIVDDCLTHYQDRLDPHTYLTPEWLRENDLTPEDIEAQMGFPRGYTELEGTQEEWEDRLRLLLANHPPWPDISDVVKRRVNSGDTE